MKGNVGIPEPRAPSKPKRVPNRDRPLVPAAIAGVAAEAVVRLLEPWCDPVVVVGSLRRQRAEVHDVDVVAVRRAPAKEQEPSLQAGLKEIASDHALIANGEKIKAFEMNVLFDDRPVVRIPVDLYLTEDPTYFQTLVLIRTGSKTHNIALTTAAQRKGWTLHADGRGVVDDGSGERLAWRTEAEILNALGCEHVDPATREGGH